ncbi:HEAT repeat domain-containing protein [Candidatus Poribacteria bacterium]|nr:HEAT repeat domain-containing protein [Candidatus Poribacteria bacterium]
MELWKYASAVEANYQKLAEIFLNPADESGRVERLLSFHLAPVPKVKSWYTIWSEGILAEAFACLPKPAFPRLLEALRTAYADDGLFLIFKGLTMWGDNFAEALSDWLDEADARLQQRAIHGLTLYAKLLHTFCDSETPSIEKWLQHENYPELVLFMRWQELGAPPASSLLGAPRPKLLQQLSHLLYGFSDESQQIAILRCLWQLHDSAGRAITGGWLSTVTEKIAEIAQNAESRTLEREAVIALCHLDCERGSEHIRQHWFQEMQRRSMAAEVLGIIRTETAFEMLREFVTDENPETRRKAISSIESFESDQALTVLNSLEENHKKVHRQLLHSQSQLKRKLQNRLSPPGKKRPSAIYSISPLALLRCVPLKPIFSEQELNASVEPEIIADVSSSRRYAVELGLLERRGDIYRLSEMGTVVHWIETFLQEGLKRFAESTYA